MTVLIIRWQIHRDDAADFIDSWTRRFLPAGKGLIREFLTTIDPLAPPRLRTMPLDDPDFSTFITVGFWADVAAFEEAVHHYRSRAAYPFRCGILDRLALDIIADRLGDISLPPPTLSPPA